MREKIERRYATALGSAELSKDSVEGRMLEVQQSTHQLAGRTRLEQIRASMDSGAGALSAAPGQQSLGAGAGQDTARPAVDTTKAAPGQSSAAQPATEPPAQGERQA